MDPNLPWYIVAGVLIVVGLLGTVLPVLPGLPLMFAGMALVAWLGDFALISGWTLALLGVLTLVALGVDLLASVLGAQRVGASRKAIAGAALGTLGGFFLGLPGLILGPFVGAVIGELSDGKQWREASHVGLATWIGLAVGAALKLALAFTMLGVFALALWLD